jgi:chromosome segregation ATPase
MSTLDTMILQKNKIQAQIQETQNRTSSFDKKTLESLEKQLAKSKSDSQDAQAKIKNLQSDLAQKESQKQKLYSDLKSALDRLGIKGDLA